MSPIFCGKLISSSPLRLNLDNLLDLVSSITHILHQVRLMVMMGVKGKG